MTSSHLGRVGWAVLVTSTVIATTISTSAMATAADPDPTGPAPAKSATPGGPDALRSKLHGLDRSTRGRQTVFVQLSGAGSADVAQANPQDSTDKAEVKERRADVARQSNAVLTTAKAEDTRAARLYTTANAIPGLAIRLDQDGIKAVAARSDVVKVSRITPKHLTNANAAALTKAYDTWKYTGNLGEGVKIGVIDSGIDYTHKDFGGAGTVAAYDAAKAASASPTWRDTLPTLAQAKVIGGYDFVGDDYYPDELTEDGSENPDYDPVAAPDTNPLDCEGHGTHVSGTAAGYGVTAAGDTFTGNYGSLTKPGLLDMRVGPGHGARRQRLRAQGVRLPGHHHLRPRSPGPGPGPQPGRRLLRPPRHRQPVARLRRHPGGRPRERRDRRAHPPRRAHGHLRRQQRRPHRHGRSAGQRGERSERGQLGRRLPAA